MKRLGMLLLTLAMLFVAAGAEEVFMEESFLDAGGQGEEFFSEESFFGDTFDAEALEDGAEAEAEDRSVYLFETETRPGSLAPWQNYYVRLEGAAAGRKVSLWWSLYNKYNPLEPDPEKAYTEPVTGVKAGKDALAGVKFYIYQVDPWTGVAREIRTTTAYKASITVMKPGDYIYYVRLEKVDKANQKEDLGVASQKTTIPVAAVPKDYAVKKVKIDLSNYYSTNSMTGITAFDPYITVYTNRADTSYTVTAKTKTGQLYTGKYELKYNSSRDRYNYLGSFGFSLTNTEWDLKEGESKPAFTSEGKKLTVTVQPTQYPKAKKATVKLVLPKEKKITANTPLVIEEAQQISPTSIKIRWYDAAAGSGLIKPTGYAITTNIPGLKTIEASVADLYPNGKAGEYTYIVTGIPEAEKAKEYSFSVKANASQKTRKSKSYKCNFLPAGEMSLYNVSTRMSSGLFTLYWKGQNARVKSFEIYLTDSAHTTEVPVRTISAEKVFDAAKSKKENHYDKFTDNYYVQYELNDYEELTDGYRLGFVIKAMAEDGVTVLGRVSVEHIEDTYEGYYIDNKNYKGSSSVVSFLKTAEYYGGPFDGNGNQNAPAPVQLLDEDGLVYSNATKVSNIRYTDPFGVSTDHNDWTYSNIKEIGKYKITAGYPSYYYGSKGIADAEYDFEITKATLKPELKEPEFELLDGESRVISASDIQVLNGDGREVTGYHYIKNVEVKGVTGNKIEKPGDYTVAVTIDANPDWFNGLDSSDQLKVELPLKVTRRKLRVLFKYDGWSDSVIYYRFTGAEIGEYLRYVGNGAFNTLNEDDEWKVKDGDGNVITGCETTVVVKREDGTVIKEGDIRQAGVYIYEISAKKDGYAPSATETVKVRVFDYKPGEVSTYYGKLSIHYRSYFQSKLYDGKFKMPDFTVEVDGMEVSDYITSAHLLSTQNGPTTDYAIDPGEYTILVNVFKEGYDAAGAIFRLNITNWKLELVTTSLQETGSKIDPYTALTFKATDPGTGKEIPAYDGSGTQPICFRIKKIEANPSEIKNPGAYDLTVMAYVEEYDGTNHFTGNYTEFADSFTLTVTPKP